MAGTQSIQLSAIWQDLEVDLLCYHHLMYCCRAILIYGLGPFGEHNEIKIWVPTVVAEELL